MSRLAKKPIQIPEKAEVSVSSGNVSVKGPLGTLTRHFSEAIGIAIDNKTFVLTPKNEEITTRMLWGTTASHLMNMLKGVCEPFVKKLIVEGIGFKSEVKGEELVMNLGFSHQVKVKIPKGLGVKAEKNVVTITGPDIELVGLFAARVRDLKKPEPYKGKGIRYEGEVIRRKQGKKTV